MNKFLPFVILLILGQVNQLFAFTTPTHASPANNSNTNGGITIDWNAVTGAAAYQFQLDTTSTFNSTVLISVTKTYINSNSSNLDTQYTFGNTFYYGKKYFWRVRAYTPGDTSAWSSAWTFITTGDGPALASPGNGSVKIKAGLTLDWDNQNYVTNYDWQADTVASFSSTALRKGSTVFINTSNGNPDTQVTLGDLYYGKTYYWRVRSRNSVDTSAWSTAWTFATTADGPTLISPGTGTLNIKAGLTLDWDNHNYVTNYDWQADTVASFSSSALRKGSNVYVNTSNGNTDTQVTIGGLYYGKTYYWRVRSRNAVDTSSWTNAWTFTTTADGPTLFSPGTGTLNIKAGLTLDWDNHNYVTNYDWQADTVASFSSSALRKGSNVYVNTSNGNTDTQVTIGGLYYGKTYYWRVRSRNAVDTSAWSTAWTFATTADGPALISPGTGTLNIKAGLTLDWDNHNYVTNYDWQADTVASFSSSALRKGSNVFINTSNSNPDTQVTLGDLYYGKTYYWRVRSRNAVDTSAWTNAWTFTTTADGPALFSPGTGTLNIKAGLTLDWDNHNYVTNYDWQADTVASFSSSALRKGSNVFINTSNSNPDTQVTLGDLYYGKTYYWRVRSRNSVDTSAWSTAWTFATTADGPTLFSPGTGTLNIKAGLTLDWDNHNYVTNYDWQADTVASFSSSALRKGSNVFINTSNSNPDTQVTLGDLYYGKTYYWRVRSRNSVDTSAWTNAWTFATTADGPALFSPGNNTINVSVSGITLDWDSHNYVTKYQVDIDTNNLFNSPYFIHADKIFVNTYNGNLDTQHYLTQLAANTVFYWRVRAINKVDTSAWTATWAFSTGKIPIVIPVAPLLIAPSYNSSAPGNTALLDWNAVVGVKYYDYQVDTVVTFTSPSMIEGTNNYLSTSGSGTDTQHELTNLAFDKTYYWRVRTRTTSATSAWSDIWKFSVYNTTAINENKQIGVSIFPNPTSDKTTFTFSGELKNAVLTIYNLAGVEMKKFDIPGGTKEFTIYRNGLPAGQYVIRLEEDRKVTGSGKFVISN